MKCLRLQKDGGEASHNTDKLPMPERQRKKKESKARRLDLCREERENFLSIPYNTNVHSMFMVFFLLVDSNQFL